MVPRVVAHPSTCEIRKATASNSRDQQLTNSDPLTDSGGPEGLVLGARPLEVLATRRMPDWVGRAGCSSNLRGRLFSSIRNSWPPAISNIRKKRGRGRPKVGAVPVMVRLLPEQATSLDDWREKQIDRPGRPEAIRRLIAQAFAIAAPSAPAKSGSRRKAAELAGRAMAALRPEELHPHDRLRDAGAAR